MFMAGSLKQSKTEDSILPEPTSRQMNYMKKNFLLVLLCSSLYSWSQTGTLEYYLQLARKNNPLKQEYQNQVLSNRIDSQILRANLKPRVDFINNLSYAPVIKGFGYDEAITNIANIALVVQARRNIISKPLLKARFRDIELQNLSLLDSMMLSAQDLERVITAQFITAYGSYLTASYMEEVLNLMRKEDIILKKLTQASVYKQTDYLSFYVTLQQQVLSQAQAWSQYKTDLLTLYYLTGTEDTAITTLQEPLLKYRYPNAQGESVFFRPFMTDSLRLVNEKLLTAYDYKPRLEIYSDAGYTSSLQYLPYKNFGLSAGLSLVIPLYDGHQKQMRYSKIDLQENIRQVKKDFFTRQYHQQVAVLQMQLRDADDLTGKILQQISFSMTLVTANGKLLETGDIAMKDYILSINNYLNAKYLITQNNLNRLHILNQLNYWNH